MFPGPTMRSARGTVFVPNAKAAMAWAPPRRNTFRRPSNDAVPRISVTGRGEVTHTDGTPATCAGITVIINVEGSGYRPAGMYAATTLSGLTTWPTTKPGLIVLVFGSGTWSFANARIFFDAAS